MTTRIVPNSPAPQVALLPSAQRTTAAPARPFQSVLRAGASAVVSGAESAVLSLPGGPILAAAFHSSGNAVAAPGAVTAASGATGAGLSSNGAQDPTLEGALSQHADQNLYYIALQERISAENRMYTAYSNILRVRHETLKNAIGNLR
jgi:hypothetical protein